MGHLQAGLEARAGGRAVSPGGSSPRRGRRGCPAQVDRDGLPSRCSGRSGPSNSSTKRGSGGGWKPLATVLPSAWKAQASDRARPARVRSRRGCRQPRDEIEGGGAVRRTIAAPRLPLRCVAESRCAAGAAWGQAPSGGRRDRPRPFDLVLSAGDTSTRATEPVGPSRKPAPSRRRQHVAAGFHPPPTRAVELFGTAAAAAAGGSPVRLRCAGQPRRPVEATSPGGNGSASRRASRPAWRWPSLPSGACRGRHYVLDSAARIIAIDSNLLIGDYGGFTSTPRSPSWRRRPALPSGPASSWPTIRPSPRRTPSQGRDRRLLARLARLEAAAGGRIRAWLAGHDHDLQHLRAPAGYDVLVSGTPPRPTARALRGGLGPGGESPLRVHLLGLRAPRPLTAGVELPLRERPLRALYCCAADGPALPAGRVHP